LSGTYSNPVTLSNAANSFTGNGAGLTSLNVSNLVGTIADALLFTNVALRAGGNFFSGNQTVTSGNVGIGTTNPTNTLEVAGTVKIGSGGTPLTRVICNSSNLDFQNPNIGSFTNLTITVPAILQTLSTLHGSVQPIR
jgi:hypothetical protein